MATETANKNTPIIISQSSKKSWVDYLFFMIFAGAAIFFGKKAYDKWRAGKEAGKIGDSPAAQAASTIYNAKQWYGDNEESAISLAKTVKEQGVAFKDISEAFSKLYAGKNINDYLNSFMDNDQQQRFFNTLNLTATIDKKTGLPAPIASKDQWVKGKAVVTTGSTNIRKTARWASSSSIDLLNPFHKNNIIALAPINSLIGTATGRTSFDEKAEPTGILFVEVEAGLIGDDGKSAGIANVWVAASQAKPYWFKEITTNKVLNQPYKAKGFLKSAYDKTSTLSGFGATDFRSEVVATKTTPILNDKFKEVMKVNRGIILGFPVMSMKNGNRELIKFQSVGGYLWWVDKSSTITCNV